MLDPFDCAMFVFCNRDRDRVKVIEWDGDGYQVAYARRRRRDDTDGRHYCAEGSVVHNRCTGAGCHGFVRCGRRD